MTHSMTHLDVEDVLSSIRRLVSDGPAERPAEKSDSLFVLTPAHRVDEVRVPEPEEESAPRLAHNELDLSQPPINIEALTNAVVEAVEAEIEAEAIAADASTVTDDLPDQDDTGTSPVVLTDRVTQEPYDALLHLNDEPQPSDSLATSAENNVLEQRIAELEKAVGKVDDEFEPDGSEPQDLQQPKLNFLQRYRERFEVIDGDGIDRNEPANADHDYPRADPEPELEPASEPDTAPAAGHQEPLDLASVAVFSHTPRRFEPAPSDIPEEAVGTELQMTGRRDLVDRNDEFFVDEEMLRGLVSDIVKNELQGRLGERITRNVRRMVRHEIEKALSLKSLE